MSALGGIAKKSSLSRLPHVSGRKLTTSRLLISKLKKHPSSETARSTDAILIQPRLKITKRSQLRTRRLDDLAPSNRGQSAQRAALNGTSHRGGQTPVTPKCSPPWTYC